MKKINLLFLLSILLITSCKHSSKNNEYVNIVDTISIKTEDTSLTPGLMYSKKVIRIDTPSVIFFMPDYKERLQIIRFYGDINSYDFEHIFNNFRRLALDARQSLSPYDIKSYLTYAWQFDIKTDSGYIHFDRKIQNEIIGFIIADGHKQPLIKFGLYKYIEFEQFIKDYFEILDFKMLTEPSNYRVQSLPQNTDQIPDYAVP